MGKGLKIPQLPPNDKEKARRVLWYPAQAKTGLEWGTQPWVGKENCRSLGCARDDKGEGGDFY
jgi:hypothetical protein